MMTFSGSRTAITLKESSGWSKTVSLCVSTTECMASSPCCCVVELIPHTSLQEVGMEDGLSHGHSHLYVR